MPMSLKSKKVLSRSCVMNFKDIFSVDSGDIGKTPLIEMEIDTGVSPLITQKNPILFL